MSHSPLHHLTENRRRTARWAVPTVALVAVLAVALAPRPAAGGGAASPGMDLFLAQKCNFCHSIESLDVAAKNPKAKGGDLSTVGDEHDAAWIAQLLKKEVDTDAGERHEKGFKGTDEELKALVDWLASLKSEA